MLLDPVPDAASLGTPKAAALPASPASTDRIFELECDFPPDKFLDALRDVLQDTSLVSNGLQSESVVQAELVYDSCAPARSATQSDARHLTDGFARLSLTSSAESALQREGFTPSRTLVRRLVLQSGRTVPQQCSVLAATTASSDGKPHQAHTLALLSPLDDNKPSHGYLHRWTPSPSSSLPSQGDLALYPLPVSHARTSARQPGMHTNAAFLQALQFHGQALLRRQPVAPPRTQVHAAKTLLAERHSNRLRMAWAEPIDPGKRVDEDLHVAAWLIETWRRMYIMPKAAAKRGWTSAGGDASRSSGSTRRAFPGFVDLGCGAGFLTDVLLSEGFEGLGLDARRRPTWSRLPASTRAQLRECTLVPQPLVDAQSGSPNSEHGQLPASAGPPRSTRQRLARVVASFSTPDRLPRAAKEGVADDALVSVDVLHPDAFLVAHHADELTAWVPLLAARSGSAFFTVPCCPHNLVGARFRPPSAANSYIPCNLAPTFFAAAKPSGQNHPRNVPIAAGPETGDLNALARARGAEGHRALCDWIAHLAREVGFDVEATELPIQGPRNFGLLGRLPSAPDVDGEKAAASRREAVLDIVQREGVEVEDWLANCTEGARNAAEDAGHHG